MTNEPPTPTAQPTRVQMNVRVPRELRDQIDARREAKHLSRDEWVTRALTYALSRDPAHEPLVNRQGRTAPPPHRR